MLALAAVFAVALALLAWGATRAAASLSGILRLIHGELARIADGPEVPVSTRLAKLEDDFQRLPQRWEEFKNEARRAEGRARSLVADARKELDRLGLEHAGLEEQGRELRLLDGGEREAESVPAVREGVESAPAAAPGWREALLSKKYGG